MSLNGLILIVGLVTICLIGLLVLNGCATTVRPEFCHGAPCLKLHTRA